MRSCLSAIRRFPGCRIRVRPVGIFHMSDEKGPDEKVICVPLNDPTWERLTDVHDIPPLLRDEIEHFFQVYKDLDHKGSVMTNGFGNRSEAEHVINAARAAASTQRRLTGTSRSLRTSLLPDLAGLRRGVGSSCTEYGARVSRSRF